jgi:hypothetical protein
MAPTIMHYPVENLVNGTTSGNKLVGLMRFVSHPFDYATPYDYLPGFLIVLVFFVIIVLSLKLRGYSFLSSFASASIANFILVLLLFPLSVISGQILVLSTVMVGISALLLWAWG